MTSKSDVLGQNGSSDIKKHNLSHSPFLILLLATYNPCPREGLRFSRPRRGNAKEYLYSLL